MRRITRILGIVGGIGAIVWAMRDRLMSVALPREPQRPTFRVPERPPRAQESPVEPPAPDEEPSPHSITDVSGIGPVYATRLEAAGVATLADLAAADAEAVAEAAEVAVTRATGWIESARHILQD